MKITFLMLLLSYVSMAQDVEIAIKYNDKIIELNDKAIASIERLIESYETFVPKQMDSLHLRALSVVDSALKKLERLAPLENDSTFRTGAIKLFQTYKRVLKNEHSLIIKLLKLPINEYGEEQIKEYVELIDSANTACENALNELIIIQKAFARKFKFEIVEE